jgi:hypothetical protein
MSIETERWEQVRAAIIRDGHVILRADERGGFADSVALARRVAVLPEALALLKQIHEQSADWGEAEDILHRAGVLP